MPDFNSIRFQGNRSLLKELSSQRLNTILQEIRRNKPLPGRGITVRQEGNGTRIDLAATPGRRGGAGATAFPFEVVTRVKPDTDTTPPTLQWGVRYESSLFKSFRPNDKTEITGLLNHPNPSEATEGWKDIDANDVIWLGVIFSSTGIIEGAYIDSLGGGDEFDITADAWSGENGFCEDDGTGEDENGQAAPHQTTRKIIAYTKTVEDALVVVQSIRSHQIIRPTCVAGRPAQLLFDHSGGYDN
jgi:hypothetical protein